MKREQMRTWAEIDLEALAHNYRALCSCAPDSMGMGVVKANAYGHGAVEVSRKLEEIGADYLAVATLGEALELREAKISLPILILGVTPVEFAADVIENDVAQTIIDFESAQAWSAAAASLLAITIMVSSPATQPSISEVLAWSIPDATACAIPG